MIFLVHKTKIAYLMLDHITTINDVIQALDDVISKSQDEQSPVGYFAALYRKVTLKVKEGIEQDYFEDGPRMEQLDVIFAKRYLLALEQYKSNTNPIVSWNRSFEYTKRYWPTVFQHLMMGMNAHINLDLGIAAAQVSINKDISRLENDFNRINEVLAGLVEDVQHDLTEIWPELKWVLKVFGRVDNWLINFSMKLARNGAWRFATKLSNHLFDQWDEVISERDVKIVKTSKLISDPGLLPLIVFRLIRLGEKGSVSRKIMDLKE